MSERFSLDPTAAREYAKVLSTAATQLRDQGQKVNSGLGSLMATYKGRGARSFEDASRKSATQMRSISDALNTLSTRLKRLADQVDSLQGGR